MAILNALTSGTLTTNSRELTPIPGLSLTLPEGVNDQVLVILNLPNPYADGSDYPGAILAISSNGKISPVQASFTYSLPRPQSSGRMPTTLVVAVPLAQHPQVVEALWCGVRGSTVVIDSPATLSAIIA